jgi:methyltransferase (TIGR00027 family)
MAGAESARHEGDSWDLASSVGATATGVAAQRALAAKAPTALIDDPFAEPLVKAVGIDVFTRWVDGEIQVDNDDPAFGRRRMAEGIAVRTRYFDGFFAEAAEAGLRQAVILAAGLDARAYRLQWPPGSVVYEVDQPGVIEFKTRTLERLGATPTAARRPVGIDLRDDWLTALQDNGFEMRMATAWIAEGLLVYLPPEARDRLLDNISALSAPGSRLAADCVPDTGVFTGERGRAVSEHWRRLGLDFDMSDLVYHGERSHMVEYLAGRGWQTTVHTMPELYADNGFEPPHATTMAAFANAEYVFAALP